MIMTVGAEGDSMQCPAYDSERIEYLDGVPGGFTYQCADCDTEFDESAGRVNPAGRDP